MLVRSATVPFPETVPPEFTVIGLEVRLLSIVRVPPLTSSRSRIGGGVGQGQRARGERRPPVPLTLLSI